MWPFKRIFIQGVNRLDQKKKKKICKAQASTVQMESWRWARTNVGFASCSVQEPSRFRNHPFLYGGSVGVQGPPEFSGWTKPSGYTLTEGALGRLFPRVVKCAYEGESGSVANQLSDPGHHASPLDLSFLHIKEAEFKRPLRAFPYLLLSESVIS